MSKTFYVGQRVRIKYVVAAHCQHLAGREARIAGPGIEYVSPFTKKMIFGYPLDVHPLLTPTADQLEPIQPEGAAPSELSYTELMDRLKAGEVECV